MRRLAGLVGVLALATACTVLDRSETTPAPAPEGTHPLVVDEVVCAEDIRATVLGAVRCDLVEVSARPGSGGTPVTVHVTRLQPPGGASERAPILVVPSSGTPNYLGLSPMAQRTGREIVIVDARGTGHSRPALTCPEIDTHAVRELRGIATTRELRREYAAAVAACAARHRADGVDPEDFTASHVAADLAEVRTALGIDRWVVIALGGAARVVPELMRLDAPAVDALLLDSPELPGRDPVAAAVALTQRVVRGLLVACSADQECADRHPGATSLWGRARAAVAEQPITVDVAGMGPVRVDEELLVRIVRAMVSDGGSSGLSFTPAAVPAFLHEVVTDEGEMLRGEIAPLLGMQDAFCLGFAPDCLLRMRLAPGAFLSVMCDDALAPHVDTANPPDPVLAGVFGARVDPTVCERWGVRGGDEPRATLDWPTPTLVMVGRYAPYAVVSDVRRVVDGLPAGSLVVDPAGADNVLTRTECMLALRRDWIDDPVADVAPPACLDGERVDWYLRPP